MAHTAEVPDRVDPVLAGSELDTIMGFLQYQRTTLLRKVEGLTLDQWRAAPTVSRLTLAGLVKHLAFVEESWIVEDFLALPLSQPWASVDWEADRDWEFHSAVDDDPGWLVRRYQQAWQTVDDAVAEASPDDLSARELSMGGVPARVSLRWILLHLVEETARHVGHADLIREAVDGSTGE